MIKLLPENRWHELEDIFENEFEGSDIPTRGKANIVADIDENGAINGFIVVEMLLRVGQIHIEKGNNGLARKFIKYLQKNLPSDSSVIVIASEERFERICEKLKMRECKGKVYRLDL